MIVMHMSGAYLPQNFYDKKDEVDCRDLTGTNAYCDDVAKEELRRRIANQEIQDLHFLDSGNYHYLSLLYLEKIHESFDLVLFDNHPDLQLPAFGKITSCGGWVAEAFETNANLREVYLVGVKRELVEEVVAESVYADRIHYVVNSGKEHIALDWERLKQSDRKIYISFDKDVLCTKDARCDWDQGKMSLENAISLLTEISAEKQIIGMDVCGEDVKWQEAPDANIIVEINNATNHALHNWWLSNKIQHILK